MSRAYKDPTADTAIGHIVHEERVRRRRRRQTQHEDVQADSSPQRTPKDDTQYINISLHRRCR